MPNQHLYILHLFDNTENEKVNEVSRERLKNLLIEIKEQGITEFTLVPGEYDPVNTKKAIHLGHRKIVQYAKDNNLNRIVIAEDDFCFTHPNSFNYFISQIPKSYDIFSGLVYSASMQENRIMNGGSGMTSLYIVNSRFYDFFLSMDIDNHVDRELALTAFKHEYFIVEQMCVTQRGGFSHQLRQNMWYDAYLEGKEMYKG